MSEEIQEAQINDNMSAGEMLRVARTTGRRKREISTISKQLCIREDFLQALEDGNYTALPEVVYILGFARNYAIELGLDPDVIVKKIKNEIGIEPKESAVEHQHVAEQPKNYDVKEKIGKRIERIRDCKVWKFVIKRWKWLVGILVLLIVLGGVIGAFMVPKVEEKTIVEVVAPKPSNEPAYRQTVRERFGSENRANAEIVLQAVEESWVKIEDGRGKTVFSRVLVPGDLYYVPVGNKNKATFGNVGGVDIWVRGELVPKVGTDHTRKTGIILDPETLMKNSDKDDTDKTAEN